MGDHTVVGGYNNKANHYGEAVFGANNTVRGQYTFVAGKGNSTHSGVSESNSGIVILGANNIDINGVVIGYSNNGSMGGATSKSGYLFGKYLSYYNSVNNVYNSGDTIVIGSYNTKTQLVRPSVVVACGVNNSDRFNGLELTREVCKINNDLQLASDTTAVNAITPAQSSPASTDDMTLVTKSYISSDVGHAKTYWPVSEQSLSTNTSYSIGTLIGDNTWTFPYTSGSIVFALYVSGVEYRATLILPPYLDPNMTPQLKVPITACYNSNNGDNGRIDGVLLLYNTSTKEISFENPEGIEVDNVVDTLVAAYNYGNIDIWFVGLTCFDHI